MAVQLNRQTGSEPNIALENNLALHDLKALERKSVPSIFSTGSLENSSTADSKANSTNESSPSGSQDTEDLLRQTLALYSTMNNPEDLMNVSIVGPVERRTKFSTMKTVPLDMETLKEDLSYYQYKLYQKFSIKMSDLVKLETLGKGAFGEVTRVFNKTDRKFYALKEIKKESFKKAIYFESAVWTEIQNLLKVTELNDTSLLRTVMIEFDEDEESCFMLMELGGGTLEEYADCMRAYGFEWKEEELEYILHHLATQIKKLKEIGMIHRDIKPSNVIISCKEDSFKLGDLGCACITVEGVQKLDIAGTPHYMSPEVIQAVMRREPVVDHDPYLSDLFSLGITMLTLIEPNLKRNIVGKIMETVVKVKYPGLYPIFADLLGSPVKREEGMQKVLSKTPRLKSYKDFTAGNVGDKYRLYLYYKIITKNKNIDTSFYFDMFILDDALMIINKKIHILTKDKNPEDQNLEEVVWRIRRARCYYMQLNYEVALNELIEITQRKELKSFDTPNVMTKAKALLWLGIVKSKLGRFDEALDHLMHCLGIRVAEYGELHEDVSAVFWQLGTTYMQQENCRGAIKAFTKCVEIGEKLDPKERKYMAKSLNYLAMFSEWRSEHEEALKLFERARDTAIETHGEHHPAVADQYLGIAYENILLGRNDEGVELYERALAVKKRWYGENNPEVADAYTKMARGYERLGDYTKAQELVSHSISIWKNVSGEESQELAEVYQFVGAILCKKGHYMKSLEFTNKVMSIKEKHLGEDNPRMAGTYIWHAEICSALSLESDKQKSLQKLLAINFDNIVLNVDSARIGFRTSRLLAEEGKTEQAWNYLQKGYQMCINLAVAKTSKAYACYCEAVGRIRFAEGKYDLALEGLKEAISIRGMHPCHDPDIFSGICSVMGDIYEALNNNKEALEWRKQCEDTIKLKMSKGGLPMLKALTDSARVLQKLGQNEEAEQKLKDAKSLVETVGIAKCHPITHVCIDLESALAGRQKPNGK